ncbi:E3 ubiquitin-protein ligase UBR2, partial [Fragariocoptes setiger]
MEKIFGIPDMSDWEWFIDSHTPNELQHMCEDNDFRSSFHRFISRDVLLVLSPHGLANSVTPGTDQLQSVSHDNPLVRERLLKPLERFICGLEPITTIAASGTVAEKSSDDDDKLDPIPILRSLSQRDNPSTLCGRIFKNGDATFSCRDCSLDPTCVLCVECFERSPHKNHHYRMSTANGGGCCDCGDREAWRAHYACTAHMRPDAETKDNVASSQQMTKQAQSGRSETTRLMEPMEVDNVATKTETPPQDLDYNPRKEFHDAVARLPPTFALRYALVCHAVIRYAMLMVTWRHTKLLPDCLNESSLSSASTHRMNHDNNDDIDDDDASNQQQYNNTDISSNTPHHHHALRDEDKCRLQELASDDPMMRNYYTVLFNDEVHTYDQVISTLERVIKCSKRTANTMASTISREGRTLVMCSDEPTCLQIKEEIVRLSSRFTSYPPLQVEVMHARVLAHQAFAVCLIPWLKQMASYCDAFRWITAHFLRAPFVIKPPIEHNDVTGEGGPGEPQTMLEFIMESNTDYWKVVRCECNELLISVMLKDYSLKLIMARYMTRAYPRLVHKHTLDDHEFHVSCVSLGVQLYTVPSLAIRMIEECNALHIFMSAFVDKCRLHCVDGVLSFERRNSLDLHRWLRSFCLLQEIDYMLSHLPPLEDQQKQQQQLSSDIATKRYYWSDRLCTNFVDGVRALLELLHLMHDMDATKRQTGAHLEYEPEWENGIRLQQRLGPVLGHTLAWIATNPSVLVQSVRLSIGELRKYLDDLGPRVELTMPASWQHPKPITCLNYDVATLRVSIHIPLARFVAALVHQLMSLEYDSVEGGVQNTAEVRKTLAELDKLITPLELMEFPLRTLVMYAQFRANMWRRNGYALVHQFSHYHNMRARAEMFDRDIQALQVCAARMASQTNIQQNITALLGANEFLVNLVHRFNLAHWMFAANELPVASAQQQRQSCEQELADEFLHLLVTLLGERYRVGLGSGVTQTDITQHEITQILSIESMSRSDLLVSLEPLSATLPSSAFEDGADVAHAIDAVARFRRASATVSGRYELREERYAHFNPYFYHFSRREQSNAQDAQLKRRRAQRERWLCCPPPETVPELTKPYRPMLDVLRCDCMLSIMRSVMARAIGMPPATGGPANEAPECQVDKTLFLIGMALNEQQRAPTTFDFVQRAQRFCHLWMLLSKLNNKLNTQSASSKSSQHGTSTETSITGQGQHLAAWTMDKFLHVLRLCLAKCKPDDPTLVALAQTFLPASQPHDGTALSADTVAAIDDKKAQENAQQVANEKNNEARERRNQAAAARRARILAQMQASQQAFLANAGRAEQQQQSQQPSSQPPTTRSSGTSSTGSSGSSSNTTGESQSVCSRLMNLTKTKHLIKMSSLTQPSQSKQSTTTNSDISTNESGVNKTANLDLTTETADIEEPEKLMCILCREEQVVALNNPCMVLVAYVQRSTVLSKNRQRPVPNCTHVGPVDSNFDPLLMPADLHFGPHVSTCGHVMHHACWDAHYKTTVRRERTRHPTRAIGSPVVGTVTAAMNVGAGAGVFMSAGAPGAPNDPNDPLASEFDAPVLCPLCESVSNSVIPLLPRLVKQQRPSSIVHSKLSLFRLASLTHANAPHPQPSITLKKHSSDQRQTAAVSDNHKKTAARAIEQCIHALRAAVDKIDTVQVKLRGPTRHDDRIVRRWRPRPLNDVLAHELDEHSQLSLRVAIDAFRAGRLDACGFSKATIDSLAHLAQRIYSCALNVANAHAQQAFAVHDDRLPLMTYWCVAYTIHAHERVVRAKRAPLFPAGNERLLCTDALVRFAHASNMIASDDVIRSHCVRTLRYLLVKTEHATSSLSCLDVDALNVLATLTIALPNLYAPTDYFDTVNRNSASNTSAASPSSSSDSSSFSSGATSAMSQAMNDGRAWIYQNYGHDYVRSMVHVTLVLHVVQVIITWHTQRFIRSRKGESNKNHSSSSTLNKGAPITMSLSQLEQLIANSNNEAATANDDITMTSVNDEIATDTETTNGDSSKSNQNKEQQHEAGVVLNFYRELIVASGHPWAQLPPISECLKGILAKRLHARLVPFLRCVALFFHSSLSDADIPHALRCPALDPTCLNDDDIDLDPADAQQLEALNDEYVALCQYLELPRSIGRVLECHQLRPLALVWARHSRVRDLINAHLATNNISALISSSTDNLAQPPAAPQSRIGADDRASGNDSSSDDDNDDDHYHDTMHKTTTSILVGSPNTSSTSKFVPMEQQRTQDCVFVEQPHSVNRLIELPHDYSQLLQRVAQFGCPNSSNEDSRQPTQCLVCGEVLCSLSYCCQRDLASCSNTVRNVTAASGSATSAAQQQNNLQHQQQQLVQQAQHLAQGLSVLVRAQRAAQAPNSAQQQQPQNAQPNDDALDTNTVRARVGQLVSAVSAATAPHLISVGTASGLMGPGGSARASFVGSCVYHAYECGAGVGLFLRTRDCKIVMLNGKAKGCYVAAPYVDEYGEADMGLHRGYPLHLARDQYERLELVWLRHAIPEHVSRALEYAGHTSNIEWSRH